MNAPAIASRIAAVLWVVWGLVHMLAGVLTMTSGGSAGFAGIADAVDPAALEAAYHPAAEAILHQHGWNLGWVGLTTVVCAPWVWRGRAEAVFLAALTGGLTDVGYFVFLDLGGFVNFVPGTVMTIFSGAAIVLSVGATWARRRAA